MVMGATMVVLLWRFPVLFWIMRTGRIPPCSLPTTGSKSARYTSPRFMLGLFMSIFPFFDLYVIPQPHRSRTAAIYTKRISPLKKSTCVPNLSPTSPAKPRVFLPLREYFRPSPAQCSFLLQSGKPKAQHERCAVLVAAMSWESHPDAVLAKPPPLL